MTTRQNINSGDHRRFDKGRLREEDYVKVGVCMRNRKRKDLIGDERKVTWNGMVAGIAWWTLGGAVRNIGQSRKKADSPRRIGA